MLHFENGQWSNHALYITPLRAQVEDNALLSDDLTRTSTYNLGGVQKNQGSYWGLLDRTPLRARGTAFFLYGDGYAWFGFGGIG